MICPLMFGDKRIEERIEEKGSEEARKWILSGLGGENGFVDPRHKPVWVKREGVLRDLYYKNKNLVPSVQNLKIVFFPGVVVDFWGKDCNPKRVLSCAMKAGLGNFFVEMEVKHSVNVPSHDHPEIPVVGKTSYAEFQEIIKKFSEAHAYSCVSASFQNKEWEKEEMEMPRMAYFSFVGHFDAPSYEEESLLWPIEIDTELCFRLSEFIPDGVKISIRKTINSRIRHLTVTCQAGGWKEEGFIKLPLKEIKNCCGKNVSHGSAWRSF
ncbi:MAG: hypothetical protein WC178_00165 [Candidatus Paceibacterota bacterium]